VAMPAWSCPGCHSVSKPRIRCQRVRMSCRVLLKAWPTCSAPVTLGGGIITQKVSSRLRFAPARKAPAASHICEMRASAPTASKVLSIAMGSVPSLVFYAGVFRPAGLRAAAGEGKDDCPRPPGSALRAVERGRPRLEGADDPLHRLVEDQ